MSLPSAHRRSHSRMLPSCHCHKHTLAQSLSGLGMKHHRVESRHQQSLLHMHQESTHFLSLCHCCHPCCHGSCNRAMPNMTHNIANSSLTNALLALLSVMPRCICLPTVPSAAQSIRLPLEQHAAQNMSLLHTHIHKVKPASISSCHPPLHHEA